MAFREDVLGKWVGSYELWLEPDKPPTGSITTLQAVANESGATIALRYEWSFEDNDHKGVYLISEPGDVAFRDTFHTADSVMTFSERAPLDVFGTYDAEGNTWGWRTKFEMSSPDELTITAWNVMPSDEEFLATKAEYKRI